VRVVTAMTNTHKLALTLGAVALAVGLSVALPDVLLPEAQAQTADVSGELSMAVRPAPAPKVRPLPPTYYYPYVAENPAAGAGGGFDHLVRWLTCDTPHATGGCPNWEADEVYQAAGWGGGALRRVPGNKHDMDSLPAAWAPAVNDWVVLRSQTGMYGTRFGLYLELHATTTILVLMFPLDNWATVVGGADASPPGFPAASIGAGAATVVAFTVVNGAYRMSAVADATMLQLLSDNAGTRYWMYIGELNGAKSDGAPADDRPFVIYDTPGTIRVLGSDNLWNRISPVDDATPLTTGFAQHQAILVSAAGAGEDAALLGQWDTWSTLISFADAGSRHLAGSPRSMGVYAYVAGALVQTADLCLLGVYAGGSSNGVLMRWDCATAYAGAAALVIPHRGSVAVPRDWTFGGGY